MIMVRRYTWDNLLEPLIFHLRKQDWLTDLLKFTGELKQNLNLLYFRHPAPPSPHYIESIDSNNNCVAILFFANAIVRRFSALKEKNAGKLE